MSIVMGLDQHRAQITAEWLDTATGEIGRARVAPAHHTVRSRTEIRLGVRAHNVPITNRAHAPPSSSSSNRQTWITRLTRGPCTDKDALRDLGVSEDELEPIKP